MCVSFSFRNKLNHALRNLIGKKSNDCYVQRKKLESILQHGVKNNVDRHF